ELLAQRRVLHGRAAVLDHDRASVELPDVRERLEKRRNVASGGHAPHSACRGDPGAAWCRRPREPRLPLRTLRGLGLRARIERKRLSAGDRELLARDARACPRAIVSCWLRTTLPSRSHVSV